MGCTGSADGGGVAEEHRQTAPLVTARPGFRRNLTVEAFKSEDADRVQGVDLDRDDRGLIAALSESDIAVLMQDVTSCPYMFGYESETDYLRMRTFEEKMMRQLGAVIDPADRGLGYACRKGKKPHSPNQDSWCILEAESKFALYGIFDGHGRTGHDVSSFVKEFLPKLLIRDSRFTSFDSCLFGDAFREMQGLIGTATRMAHLNADKSGTTATVVVRDFVEDSLVVAHAGDSSAVLANRMDDGSFEAVQLTRDHKPQLEDERQRIEEAGGKVKFDGHMNYRVYAKHTHAPGLNMSRCLGDLWGHTNAGLTAEPEVTTVKLGPTNHLLLVCSDGVWEVVSPQEAVEIVCEHGPEDAMAGAEALARESRDRWIFHTEGQVVDDITVVVAFLSKHALNISPRTLSSDMWQTPEADHHVPCRSNPFRPVWIEAK